MLKVALVYMAVLNVAFLSLKGTRATFSTAREGT